VAKSTNATTGGTEQFWVTAPYIGTYYLVVKRATETTGSGAFTLSSQGLATANVTLNTPGLSSASNVVHYMQNGVLKAGSIVANAFSDYVDTGTTLTIDNPIYASATQRYITTDTSSFMIQSNATFTVSYKTQYYIAVNSDHDAPTASQWVDQGGSFTFSAASPTEIVVGDHQWACAGYSLDGGSSQQGTSYTFINVQAPHTLVFNWKKQFWIQISSAHGALTASTWVDQGGSFTAAVTSPADVTPNSNQWVCTGYDVDGGSLAAGTSYTFTNVEVAHMINFSWKQQFYLTVDSAHGSPSGGGWYDPGATANAVLSSGTVSGGTGVQYIFAGWGNDASGTSLTSNSIIMDGPKTATTNWKTQYYLTTSTAYGTAGGAGWYDSGVSAFAAVSPLTAAGTAGTQYVFAGWSGDASGTTSPSSAVLMDGPKTATANWKTQYYLAISASFGSVSPSNGWYDSGSTVPISAATPSTGSGERYVWNGWTGTGSGNYTGTDNSASVKMNNAVTETASWTHQYMLTVTSPYGSPTPASGWFDAGTPITTSVGSPVAATIVQYVCTGWTGTGSVPASGAATSVQFTIDQPSTVTWNWATQFYLSPELLVAIILTVLIVSASFLLWRKRQKRRRTGGASEQALPQPPPY
jgi:uncharacterized repeat protein (TIGR02543 family)